MELVNREPTDTIGHPNQEDVGCVDKLAIFSETVPSRDTGIVAIQQLLSRMQELVSL